MASEIAVSKMEPADIFNSKFLSFGVMSRSGHLLNSFLSQWEEPFFPKTSVAIVILFWLKWAGYLAMAGLNLLAQISDRTSPGSV